MEKTELQKIIKEEIKNILNENNIPKIIKISSSFNTDDGTFIKINDISIIDANSKQPLIAVDYEYKTINGKKGKQHTSMGNFLNYINGEADINRKLK